MPRIDHASTTIVLVLLTLLTGACHANHKHTVQPTPNTVTQSQRLYLAAGGEVWVYRIDTKTGKLTRQQTLALPGAGPMTASADRRRLYVVATHPNPTEKPTPQPGKKPRMAPTKPAIATLKVADDGSLSIEHMAPANQRAGYLMVDRTGRFMAGNHYGSGTITIWQFEDGVYRGTTVMEPTLEKRVHSTIFSPDNRFLLVPATGPNKIFVMRFDEKTGRVMPHDPPFVAGPQTDDAARQPRHLVFHPTLPLLYTSNERELPGAGMWTWDAKAGKLSAKQQLPSETPKPTGQVTTADVHITPDARFLYVSNRDLGDRKSKIGNDTIAGYQLDLKTGHMTSIGYFPCEHIPRSIDMDVDARFLYVAGQMGDKMGAYRIDSRTGDLTRIAQYETLSRPIWVHCMKVGP